MLWPDHCGSWGQRIDLRGFFETAATADGAGLSEQGDVRVGVPMWLHAAGLSVHWCVVPWNDQTLCWLFLCNLKTPLTQM